MGPIVILSGYFRVYLTILTNFKKIVTLIWSSLASRTRVFSMVSTAGVLTGGLVYLKREGRRLRNLLDIRILPSGAASQMDSA